jgi:hypothetical protein
VNSYSALPMPFVEEYLGKTGSPRSRRSFWMEHHCAAGEIHRGPGSEIRGITRTGEPNRKKIALTALSEKVREIEVQDMAAQAGASFWTAGVSPPSQSGCLAVESWCDVVLKISYFPVAAASLVFAKSWAICSRFIGWKVSRPGDPARSIGKPIS